MVDTEKILDKIRALLKKTPANGCTEEEASLAAERAAELMAKYNLELKDAEGSNPDGYYLDKVSDFVFDPMSQKHRHKSLLAHAIADVNYCYMYFMTSGEETGIHLQGKSYNVMAAFQTYDYLITVLENLLWNERVEYKSRYGVTTGRGWNDSWRVGFAGRVAERLREAFKKMNDDGFDGSQTSALALTSLYLQSQDELQKYREGLGWKFTNSKSWWKPKNYDAYMRGKEAGDGIGLGSSPKLKTREKGLARL